MKKASISALMIITVIAAVYIAVNGIDSFNATNTDEVSYLPISESPVAAYKLLYPKKKSSRNEKGIKPAMEWLMQVRQDPTTGLVSYADVYNARRQYQNLSKINQNTASKRALPLNLTWEELGPDNIGGRTRAVVIDRDNPDLMWAASVSGGLFYSTDGSLSWNLHPFTRNLKYLGISSMVQDLNGDLVVSTGEGFSPANDINQLGRPPTFSAPGFIGDGLFRVYRDTSLGYDSMPGSIPVPNDESEAFALTYRVAVSPYDANSIYAATNGGLFVSKDGGLTFNPPTGIPLSFQNRPCVEVTVNSTGTVYAALNARHYFRSSDGGSTFTDMAGQNGFPGPAAAGELRTIYQQTERVEFAVTPEDPNYVYALFANDAAGLLGIFKSTNQGLNWTKVVSGGENGFNPQGGQGTWNIAFGIDPTNKERLILGGQLELWSIDLLGNRDLIAYWQPEITTNPYYVHADMHVVAWHPTDPNVMFIAGDGGVFRTNNAQAQFPAFIPRNKGYNTLQFYGFGAGLDGSVLGGSQDNGTNLNDCNNNSPLSFREVQGGDGGGGEISHINPNAMFAATPSSSVTRSSNGGQSFGGFFDENIDASGSGQPSGNGLFNSPFHLWEQQFDSVYNVQETSLIVDTTTNTTTAQTNTVPVTVPVEKSIFMLPTGSGLWFTPDALDFSNTPRWYRVSASGQGSEIGTAADGTTFIGTTNGNVTRVDGIGDKYKLTRFTSGDVTVSAHPSDPNKIVIDTIFTYSVVPDFGNPAGWVSGNEGISSRVVSQGFGGRYVTGIAVNQKNANHVVVTLGHYGRTDHVYQTTNALDPPAGQSSPLPQWEQIDNSTLPDMPVYDVVIDYENSNNVIIGTDLGVWATSNALDGSANVEWYNEANGDMTAVPVFKVRQDALYDNDCRVLYVGTHGRGSFRSTSLVSGADCDFTPCKSIVGIEDNAPVVVSDAVSNISIYPNPVVDIANIEFTLNENVKVDLRVVDLMGRVVKAETLANTTIGDNKQTVDLSSVSTGVYVVALSYPGKVITRKVVVR